MNFPPDLVLFDCDGVLVDSEPVTNRLLQENLAARGLTVPYEEIITLFVGGTMKKVGETASAMGAKLEDTWLMDIYQAMFDRLAEEVTAIPGAADILDALEAAGVGFAVCSNGPHAKMDVTLVKTGLVERVEGYIYSREDVPKPKPAPDLYLKAASDNGVPPARCVVVEDSPTGARAGRAAGMYTIGFAAETDPARLAPICDVVVSDMAELQRLLLPRG